jgi:hypothetical protein
MGTMWLGREKLSLDVVVGPTAGLSSWAGEMAPAETLVVGRKAALRHTELCRGSSLPPSFLTAPAQEPSLLSSLWAHPHSDCKT